ncbi:MAG: translation initiation factor IF-3 [Vigna little leaf phytoplasma]|nr:translation initiation factor IF-3 [Vigna little leaf phytoplasma]
MFIIKQKKNKNHFTKFNFLYDKMIPQGNYLVIDENEKILDVLELSDIIELAEKQKNRIVMINTKSNPKVVRLMNAFQFNQFCYQQNKKAKEIKKKQRMVVVKELRISPNIDDNDLKIKIKKTHGFLNKNYKVKILIRFKGRMVSHIFLGEKIFQKIMDELKDIAIIDVAPKMEGNQMIFILVPKK